MPFYCSLGDLDPKIASETSETAETQKIGPNIVLEKNKLKSHLPERGRLSRVK